MFLKNDYIFQKHGVMSFINIHFLQIFHSLVNRGQLNFQTFVYVQFVATLFVR